MLKHWVVEDCGTHHQPACWSTSRCAAAWCRGWAPPSSRNASTTSTGQLINGSLADYLVPMACEMPDIDIGHVETPTPDTELGAKGCGEAGTAAASAAALNAVNDALRAVRRDDHRRSR